MNQTTAKNVTQEQIDACRRVYDQVTHEVFYQVASATTPGIYYNVRYLKGKATLTCTCPAGIQGRSCWHRRAALAHAKLYRAAQKADHEAMLRRIEHANQHPYQWSEEEVKRDMQLNQGRTFRLMR